MKIINKIIKSVAISFLCIGMIISCNSGYDYWELSEFNMQQDALQDMDSIRMVYYSNGPALNDNDGAYIHSVVVSVKTGDTIIILEPSLGKFSPNDGDKIFYYISSNSEFGKILSADVNFDKYTKVIRDPKFDKIAHNDFPTVIGYISMPTDPFAK